MTAYYHHSETPTIPAATRCDRCPAKATVRTTLPRQQGTLYFCGHHYIVHAPQLDQDALAIEDERATPAAQPYKPEAVNS